MNKKFVNNLGAFLLIFAFLISALTFYFWHWDFLESAIVSLIAICYGVFFWFLYSKIKKINKLIKSSAIINIIGSLVISIFFILTLISFGMESYANIIIWSIGLIFSGIIYAVSIVLLIVNWFLQKNKL